MVGPGLMGLSPMQILLQHPLREFSVCSGLGVTMSQRNLLWTAALSRQRSASIWFDLPACGLLAKRKLFCDVCIKFCEQQFGSRNIKWSRSTYQDQSDQQWLSG